MHEVASTYTNLTMDLNNYISIYATLIVDINYVCLINFDHVFISAIFLFQNISSSESHS
jgi:hypothetical protein